MTMDTDETCAKLKEIGRCAYESIAEMVAALECDYDRLEELREERDSYQPADDEPKPIGESNRWSEANPDDAAELAELEKAAGDCESREDAEQRIQEDPLSLEVRTGWYTPGGEAEVEEFNILLSTGGPAVRILGELSGGEPRRAYLQVQDWFTPWTDYIEPGTADTILTYAQQFYFGE